MSGPRSPRLRHDRGSVVPLVALGLVLMLIMVAFAIDLGNARQNKGKAQSTTDAAALAGAGAYARFNFNGVADDGTVATAVTRAADWAFKNLSLPTPPKTDCGTDTYCFTASDGAHTTVQITTPYTSTKTKPDGTPYNPAELIHVKACWDVATQIASVIGISTLHVCSESTGRGVAPTAPNSDGQDEAGDPYARCAAANEGQIFDQTKWFPTNRDVHDGTTFGGTFYWTSDLNQASVVFTIDGVDYTAPNVVSPARATDSPAVQLAQKAASAGMFKWEIKYNKLPDKATLGNGVHTVALYAAALDGKCYQSIWTFTINKAPPAPGSTCQEDLFRGGSNPPTGSKVTVGEQVGANYFDETPMFTYTGTDPGTLTHNLIFNIDPALNPASGGIDAGQPNPAFNVPIDVVNTDLVNPPPGRAYRYNFVGSGGGEYKYGTKVWYTLPDSLVGGQHVIYLRAYDSDQNKKGGDCGIAQWTINFVNPTGTGTGSVELIE